MHARTHARTHERMHAHMHTQRVAYEGNGAKEKVFKKKKVWCQNPPGLWTVEQNQSWESPL